MEFVYNAVQQRDDSVVLQLGVGGKSLQQSARVGLRHGALEAV